ncbi:MAG: outer membrane beta-barrel protein [Parvibaculales bacterium]
MPYVRLAGFIVSTLLLVTPSVLHAEGAKDYYLTMGAVLESDFEFAGNLNDLEEEGSGYYLGAGKLLSDMISLELAFTDANDYSNSAGQVSEVNMIELSGLARLNKDMPVTPYIRLGLYHARADMNNSPGADETGFLYGVGLDYELSEGHSLRLDFTPGSVDGEDLERLMIGLVVSFHD